MLLNGRRRLLDRSVQARQRGAGRGDAQGMDLRGGRAVPPARHAHKGRAGPVHVLQRQAPGIGQGVQLPGQRCERGVLHRRPELIKKHFPDFRKLINELQRYSVSGTIDAGILVNVSDENLKTLVTHLKGKEFSDMRKWVVNNLDNDPVKIFRKIYDNMYDSLQPETIPHAVLIIADYQYKSAFVADQEINLVACLTELMSQVKFK